MKKPRVGIQQRVLPSYRVSFFELLVKEFDGMVSLFYGKPRKSESIYSSIVPENVEVFSARNFHILKGKAYLCWQVGMMKWLQTRQPDVLIMEANPRYVVSRTAMKWMHSRNRKVIGWGLGSPPPSGIFSRLRKTIRSNFIDNFDALITYSQKGADEYKQLGYDPQKIFVAPNAVASAPKQKITVRPAKFERNKAVILFVGRLQARKNVDLLIRACANLKKDDPPALWIVGDGPERKSLEMLADEINPETHFYGAVHGKDLQTLFKKADLFVLPGTGGLAVQEAMSNALPVIVGVADGTQSNMVSEKNGWILEHEDAEELSSLIKKALSDVISLRSKGQVSYNIVKNEINLEIMVNKFVKVIDLLTGELP